MRKIRHGHTKRHRLGMAARNGGLGLRSMTWLSANGHCWYCGVYVSRDVMTLDHIVPVARGGVCTLENVSLACQDCNTAKAAMSREEYRESLGAGTIFWGEQDTGRPKGRLGGMAKGTAFVVSLAVLFVVMATTATAQIVRYQSHGYPVFASAPTVSVGMPALCAAVGRLVSIIARGRDAGVPLGVSLRVAQESTASPQESGVLLIVATLYGAPTVSPMVAQQLAEGGCLQGSPMPSSQIDVIGQAVRR